MTQTRNNKPNSIFKYSALLVAMTALVGCNEKSPKETSTKDVTQLVESKLVKDGVLTLTVTEKTQQSLDVNKLFACTRSVDMPIITKKTFSNKVSDAIQKNITIKDSVLTATLNEYNVPDNTVDTVTGTLTVDCKKPDGTLYNDPKDITIKVTITDGDDTDAKEEPQPSNDTVNNIQTYTPTNNQGTNQVTTQQTQPVPDTTAPVLNTSNKSFTTTAGTPLTLATVTATDNVDGTVTVSKTGTVDFNTAGTYKVTYTAKDTANNVASAIHTYLVNPKPDTTAPVLNTSTKTFTTTAGTPLTLATVTATDNVDGTVAVSKTGTVDFNTAGTYKVTYTAKDSANNVASAVHTYVVEVNNTAPTAEDVNSIDVMVNGSPVGEKITYDMTPHINDAEDGKNIQIEVVTAPQHGGLVWNGNKFTYEVTDGSGYVGDDSFTYRVKDSKGKYSETKTVSLKNIFDT